MKIIMILSVISCIISVIINAYLHNIDAVLGWVCATIFSIGALINVIDNES